MIFGMRHVFRIDLAPLLKRILYFCEVVKIKVF